MRRWQRDLLTTRPSARLASGSSTTTPRLGGCWRARALKQAAAAATGVGDLLKLWAWSLTEYHRVVHLDKGKIVAEASHA